MEFIRSDAGAFVRDVASCYAGIVWLVGGADLAEQFRIAGLIDEYRVFVIPVILGRGVPLFSGDGGAAPTALRLVDTQAFADGVVMLRYRPQREQGGNRRERDATLMDRLLSREPPPYQAGTGGNGMQR